jgi:hypothetical protein
VEEECLGERVRQATLRGRPLGGEAFVQWLERTTGRRLHPYPPGRRRERPAIAVSEAAQTEMQIGN